MLQEDGAFKRCLMQRNAAATRRYECKSALDTDDNVREMYRTLNVDIIQPSTAGPT